MTRTPTRTITIRRETVSLVHAPEMLGWRATQGDDCFEFRPGARDRSLVFQRPRRASPETAGVVGRGQTLQGAADDAEPRAQDAACVPRVPRARGRGRDLLTTSLAGMLVTLSGAARRGYEDERSGRAARTARAIADALHLARWNRTQRDHLQHAYQAGREFFQTQCRYATTLHPQHRRPAHPRRSIRRDRDLPTALTSPTHDSGDYQ